MAKYFKPSEFESCVPPCTESQCEPFSVDRLDAMRAKADIPIILNSAYRSPEWDKAHGRSGCGAHTHGTAFDIRCTDSRSRSILVSAAIDVGFRRIGIGKNFIHVDDDDMLPGPVIWVY